MLGVIDERSFVKSRGGRGRPKGDVSIVGNDGKFLARVLLIGDLVGEMIGEIMVDTIVCKVF